MKKIKIKRTANFSLEEITRRLKKAMFYMSTAYLLGDVIHSLVMDTEGLIDPLGEELTHENKQRFTKLRKSLRNAKTNVFGVATEIYEVPSVDEACAESDYYAAAVKLLIAKTVGDDDAKRKVFEYLSALPAPGPKTDEHSESKQINQSNQ